MRMVTCDFCRKEEELKPEDPNSIQRVFFSDICFDCYQEIKENYITEGGGIN